jgi:polyisoprenyl-phosphate glycosyltransferase
VTAGWLVIPAYNEAAGIAAHLDTLAAFVADQGRQAGIHFTLLVVDDGSRDATRAQVAGSVARLEEQGVSLLLLPLVRNFGQQAAIIAGLLFAAREGSDFAITIDADGEHPHELIPQLVEEWSNGAAIVHTVRRPHADLSWFKRKASAAYYALIARLSSVRIRPGMADFKLWDGALLRQLAGFLPACGSTRVFAAWLAPAAPAIEYDQRVAEGRLSRFTLTKNFSLALDGVIRYTDLPLRLSLIMSMFAVMVGIFQGAFVIWASLNDRVIPGWSSVMIIVAFFGAMQGLSIGVLGEYLLRIQFRRSMPLFVTLLRDPRRAAPLSVPPQIAIARSESARVEV